MNKYWKWNSTWNWDVDSESMKFTLDTETLFRDTYKRMGEMEEEIGFIAVEAWFREHGYRIEKIEDD